MVDQSDAGKARNRSRVVSKLFASLSVPVMTWGCGTVPPEANVSDIAVFTSLHVLAAEVSVDAEGSSGGSVALGAGPFTAAHMRRYFESTTRAYEPERMDAMLDGQQRQTAYAQALERSVAATIAANFTPVPGSANSRSSSSTSTSSKTTAGGSTTVSATQMSATTAPTSFVTDQLTALKLLLDQTSAAAVIDSPFDQLDRVADFYAAYVVKNLRVRGDSRVISPEILAALMLRVVPSKDQSYFRALLDTSLHDNRSDESPPAGEPSDRLLLLVFQAHVDPGSTPDQMVGVRLHIVDDGMDHADQVRIIRVHPTRTYDVDTGSFSESERTAAAFSGSASGTIPGKANLASQGSSMGSEEDQERQKYISHVGKIASFADSGLHTFGYNFYPSNIKVERLHPIVAFFESKTYEAHGFLDGGARDCAAIVVVPRSLRKITCRVSSVTGPADGRGELKRFYFTKDGVLCPLENAIIPPADGEQIVVSLPPWGRTELLAATVGAAPVVTMATSRPASTQPVDYTVTDTRTVTTADTSKAGSPQTVTTKTVVQHSAVDNAADRNQPSTAPSVPPSFEQSKNPQIDDYLRIAVPTTQPSR